MNTTLTTASTSIIRNRGGDGSESVWLGSEYLAVGWNGNGGEEFPELAHVAETQR